MCPRCHSAFGSIDLVESFEEVVHTMGETKGVETRSGCLAWSCRAGGDGWLLYERGVGVVDLDIRASLFEGNRLGSVGDI